MSNLPLQYLAWHYRYGLPNLFSLTWEFVRFVFNFFSIRLFLRTLFKPMLSLQVSLKGEEFASDIVAVVVDNLIMRVLGLIVRLFLIALGAAGILLTLSFMAGIIILWFILPILFCLGIYSFLGVIIK